MSVRLIDDAICHSSMDQCRSTLKDLGAGQLTAASVAHVIGMMTRHPSAAVDHTSLQARFLLKIVYIMS